MVMRKIGKMIPKLAKRMQDAENEPAKKPAKKLSVLRPGGISRIARMMQDAKTEAAKKRPVQGIGGLTKRLAPLAKKMQDAQNNPKALKNGGSVKKRSKSSCK